MYDYWYSYKVKYNKKDTNDVKIFRWDYHVYFHIPYLERILQNQMLNKKLTWFVQKCLSGNMESNFHFIMIRFNISLHLSH